MNMADFTLTCDLSWCSVMFEELWNVLLIKQRVEALATFTSSPLQLCDVTRWTVSDVWTRPM